MQTQCSFNADAMHASKVTGDSAYGLNSSALSALEGELLDIVRVECLSDRAHRLRTHLAALSEGVVHRELGERNLQTITTKISICEDGNRGHNE